VAEKVVSVRLQARVEGFTAGMQKAKASVDDLTKAAAPSKADAFGKMADKAALAGLGVATAVGVAVKRFADFDEAMSAVRANSGATGASLDALRQAAITMGADSQFSATEAAQGINEMSKAGVETADVLGGGLKGALDLAAAGQISVAEAAETAATAMTQFGLEGSKVPHIADLLANAANKAQGGVGDMAQALKQTGLVANSMGLSIEETTAGLTAFASAGLLGSDAGTSFKTMLQRLSAPTGEAAAEMDRLNISAYDSQGNFIGLANVAEQLKSSMERMEPAQRAASMSVIFGSDAVRAANVLYEQGAEGINRWTREVSESGAAARMAADLTDNLKGDVERLGGAFDSVFINTGSGANNGLRALTQNVTGLVQAIGEVPGPVLLAGGALTSLALLGPKGVLAYRNYTAQLDSLGLSLDKISTRAPRTGRALEGAATAAKGFSAALAAAAAADVLFLDDSGLPIQGLTQDLLESKDAADAFNKSIVALDTGSEGLGDTLRTAFDPSFFDKIQNKGNEFTKILTLGMADLGEPLGLAKERLAELDQTLSGLVGSGSGEQAQRIFDDIARAASEQGISVDELKAKLPQYAEALAGVSNAAANAAPAQTDLAEATDAVEQSAEEAEKALSDLRSAIEGLGSSAAQQRAAQRDFEAAIDDATASVKENGRTLDEHSAKGRANQTALDAIATATREKVAADFEAVNATKGTQAATEAATKAMQDGRKAFIDAAVAAGSTRAEAERLATQLGLVPKDVQILVSQSGALEAELAIDQAARDRTATIYVRRQIADERDRRADAALSDPVRRWQGGAIYGRGTGTSDSVAALLSNGEHVLTAAEVQKLGGQGAVYAMRAAIQRGNLPKFATGGAVAVGQFAPARLASSSGSSDGFGRGYLSGQVDFGDGLSGYLRAIVRDEMSTDKRQKGLGGF
jgi:TP901 family phage tail tape measure protein